MNINDIVPFFAYFQLESQINCQFERAATGERHIIDYVTPPPILTNNFQN